MFNPCMPNAGSFSHQSMYVLNLICNSEFVLLAYNFYLEKGHTIP